MNGCLKSGSPALLWDSADSKRKRPYTLRAVKLKDVWIGTDTHLSNRLAEEALRNDLLPVLDGYTIQSKEHSLGQGQRIDFLLRSTKGDCFLEVKSATVIENNIARYPDSETPRGVKHLQCLTKMAQAGHRAVLLYVIQRGDVVAFSVNHNHSSAYSSAFNKAKDSGVEVFALAVNVQAKGFSNPRLVPVLE